MEQKNYILKIIPLQPLPPETPDFFLYFSNKKISNNSLVRIDFQNRELVGYVLETLKISESKYLIKNLNYQLKPIKEIISEQAPLTEIQKKLAFKISRRYYLSLAHSFYLFLGFYKNFNFPVNNLIFKKNKFSLILEKEIPINLINNKKTLIICPTMEEAKIFYHKLKNKIKNLVYLNSLNNTNKYLNYFNKKNNFIGSKNSIFLPWSDIEMIIVLNQGSIFYKEFFKTPKINYLEIIEDYAKLLSCQLIYVDNFYTLDNYLKLKDKIDLPKLDFSILKDIQQIIKLIQEKDKSKIFILQKNLGRKLVCLNCYSQIKCPNCQSYLNVAEEELYCHYCFKRFKLFNNCPKCGENKLSIKTVGKQWLKKFLFNNKISFYEIDNERDLKKFKKMNLTKYVIIGSWHILNLPSNYSFFINFDTGFFSENLFLKEKYLRLAHQLSNSSEKIFINTNLPKNFLQKIKNGSIIEDLIKERKFNNLPPFCYQIKLVSRLSNLQELNKRLITIKEILKDRAKGEKIEILGPFMENLWKLKKRFQLYILIKSNKYLNLKKFLENIKYIEEIKFDDDF